MKYVALVACLAICSCAARVQAQTETRSLTIQPRVDQFDTALLRLTDAARTQNLFECGQGSALLGICIFRNPGDGRFASISGTGIAGNRIVAQTQASIQGQLELHEGTGGGQFLIFRAAGSMSSSDTLTWPAASAVGSLTNDGNGGLSWTPAAGGFICSTANNCVTISGTQQVTGLKTFTADVNMQTNATIFNTLTLGDTLSRGRVLVQGTNNVDEVVLEANRDGSGDSLRIVNNSGLNRVLIGTVDAGNSGSISAAGTVDAAMRGGTGGIGGTAGHYVNGQKRVSSTTFISSDNTPGVVNDATCNTPIQVKDGIVVGCS